MLLITIILLTILCANIAFAENVNETTTLTKKTSLQDEKLEQTNTFQNIRDALNDADDKDIIYLNGTTYTGDGNQIIINKSITIDGSGENDNLKSILDGQDLSRIFNIKSGCNVILKNIIFERANGNGDGAVIYATSGNLTLNDIVIQNLNISRSSSVNGAVIYGRNMNFTVNKFLFKYNVINNGNYMFAGSFQLVNSKTIVSNMEVLNNNITCKNQIRGTIFAFERGKASFENYTSYNGRYRSNNRFFFGTDIYSEANEINITNFHVENNTYDSKDASSIEQVGLSISILYQCQFNLKKYSFINNTIICYKPTIHSTGAILLNKPCKFNISDVQVCKNHAIWQNYTLNVGAYNKSIEFYRAMISLRGSGIISNSKFSDNFYSNGIGALQLVPSSYENPIIVDNCSFTNNFVESSRLDINRSYFKDHGGAICVSGGYNGSSIIRNCRFINNTNSQGGAITPHNNCIIENCIFINNTATKFYGGAISTEDGLDINNANITIKDCYFKNNAAPIGGAIQAKGDYIKIYNCTFVDNDALQGGGVFLEGKNLKILNSTFIDNNATHDLSYRGVSTEYNEYLYQVKDWSAYGGAVYIYGNNATISNNTFKFNSAIHATGHQIEGKGGAIYIYGNNTHVYDCYFDDNFAHSGNGSAIYVMGVNTTVKLSEFFNHNASRGTIFIFGSNAVILKSIFKANTASLGGAGIYSIGNNSLVDGCTFENNNATVHGGAIQTHGDYIRIINSIFNSNNAHPHAEDLRNGLGGAIYIQGDNNDIAYCKFSFNTARNGSAIYNSGKNLTVEDCNFHYNQAYSYNLFITVEPVVSNYTKDNKIVINVTHIGGDNIINAIYNDGSHKNIFFYNVTYEHSSVPGGNRTSGFEKINPVASAEQSKNGKLIYQDSREDLQVVNLIITRERDPGPLMASMSGDIVQEFSGRTGLYGNISFVLSGNLKSGKYNVYASHPDDRLYKGIENNTRFEISALLDLSIKKSSDRDSYFVGDLATYTITLESLGSDAHDIKVNEILPKGLVIVDYNATAGKFNGSVWSIPFMEQQSTQKLTIKVKMTENGTFTNTVNVTSRENDTDLSNNIANKTVTVKTYVDLKVTKTSNVKSVKVGDKVIWIITVKNNGIINATGVKVTDKIPSGLKYISHTTSKGEYNKNTGVWDIDELEVNETLTLTITTQALKAEKITNKVTASSNEDERNSSDNKAKYTVAIEKTNDNTTHNNASDKHSKKTTVTKSQVPVKQDKYATGNPIMLILLSLLTICIASRRKL